MALLLHGIRLISLCLISVLFEYCTILFFLYLYTTTMGTGCHCYKNYKHDVSNMTTSLSPPSLSPPPSHPSPSLTSGCNYLEGPECDWVGAQNSLFLQARVLCGPEVHKVRIYVCTHNHNLLHERPIRVPQSTKFSGTYDYHES